MNELQKLQHVRKGEEGDVAEANLPSPSLGDEDATQRERPARGTEANPAAGEGAQCAKQSQFGASETNTSCLIERDCANESDSGEPENEPKQTQFHNAAPPEDVEKEEAMTSGALHARP
jgi:hypothetical protein